MISIQKINQALILAGGEGSRLGAIAKNIPKSMVEINGRPFLEYQFELLARNGITSAVLCVGYLWEQIEDHFGDMFTSASGAKLNLRYSVEPRFLGTGGAIKITESFIDELFFVVNGDTYLSIDYQTLGKVIRQKGVVGVTTVYENPKKDMIDNIQVDDDGFILKYDKQQPSQALNGVEAGVAIFSKKLLQYLPEKIPENQKTSLETDIYPKLIDQRQLAGYFTNIRFYDMGTPERIEIISEVLL